MLRICFPIVFLMVFATACQQNNAQSGDFDGLGAGFAEKNPEKPTHYVDTSGSVYPWVKMYNAVQSIKSRIQPPSGFLRKPLPKGSFGEWLRGFPLKPGKPKVMLYNGQPKENQEAQFAVLDIDVGKRDLQQCADAVMRLRAEYLFAQKQHDQIHFNFTSGTNCPWTKWRDGFRPIISGNSVTWSKKSTFSETHENFRTYMDVVFTYAGTASLEKELLSVASMDELQSGDVLIEGGFPGHAVLVMDVAEDTLSGKRAYLLAQSYMPAQDIHILVNPNFPDLSPWYLTQKGGSIQTPEWIFIPKDLRRFNEK
jgi:hypothetical protein